MQDDVNKRIEAGINGGRAIFEAAGPCAGFTLEELDALMKRSGVTKESASAAGKLLMDAIDYAFYRGYNYAKNQAKRRRAASRKRAQK